MCVRNSPPTEEQLQEWGTKGIDQLYYYYYRMEKNISRMGGGSGKKIPRRISANFSAPKTRPLEEKLAQVRAQLSVEPICQTYNYGNVPVSNVVIT